MFLLFFFPFFYSVCDAFLWFSYFLRLVLFSLFILVVGSMTLFRFLPFPCFVLFSVFLFHRGFELVDYSNSIVGTSSKSPSSYGIIASYCYDIAVVACGKNCMLACT